MVIKSRDREGVCHFDKMYICSYDLKEGFISSCWPIIGIDGCFLKDPSKVCC